MENNSLEHQPNEIEISAGGSFPEFNDNFVSVEGILYNNSFQELLGPEGPEVSSGRSQSLTLYKSEPDPLDSFQGERGNLNMNVVKIDQYDVNEGKLAEAVLEAQVLTSPIQEISNNSGLTPIFGEDEEELRPPKVRNRKKRFPNESTMVIPRLLGTSEQNQNASKNRKDVEFFVRQNIEEYLVRRGFRQVTRPSTLILPAGKTRMNAISYGPQYEAQEITGEIEKFWKFYSALKTEDTKFSDQLKRMLVPLLIHFYDECFLSGETSIALRLYTDFGNQFLQEDNTTDNYDILLTISKVSTIDEFEENELIQYLRRKDYIFMVSKALFERLKVFLRSTGCPAFLNLFANRLIIKVEESEVEPTYEEFSASGRMEDTLKNFPDTRMESNYIAEKIKGSVLSNLPTLSLYTTDNSPMSGAVSSQASMLAYGLSNAEIRISFTSRRILNNVNLERKRSRRKRRSVNNTEYDNDEEASAKDLELSTINTLKGHSGSVSGLIFHPRTRVLFSVSEDTKMKAWDLLDFECKAEYRGHTAPIWCIDQTDSGHLLVTGSMDSTARIWVPERMDYLRMLAGHYFDVDCVQFHPNESYVATGSVDKSARLWSVADGNLVRVFTGMNSPITSLKFHENGRYLIGSSEDPMILVWDIAESEVIAEIPSPPFCRDISLNGNMLSACFANNEVLVWNINSIVGGSGDAYNSVVEDDQMYKLRPPKVHECFDQAKSLFHLFYRDPENLYCLGETPASQANNRSSRKHYSRNPLTKGILAKPNDSRLEESDSDSGSEITTTELLSQASGINGPFRYDDINDNDVDISNFENNGKEEIYQFC